MTNPYWMGDRQALLRPADSEHIPRPPPGCGLRRPGPGEGRRPGPEFRRVGYGEGRRVGSLVEYTWRGVVHADWATPARVSFVNEACRIFYIARNGIDRTEDAEHQEAMDRRLHAAATSSGGLLDGAAQLAARAWERGLSSPTDLRGAFEHLWENQGDWEDEWITTYRPDDQSFVWNRSVRAPGGFVNFMRAVDDILAELSPIMREFDEQERRVAEAMEPAEQLRDWNLINAILVEIKNGAERAKPLVWAAHCAGGELRGRDGSPIPIIRDTGVRRSVGVRAARISSFMGAIDRIQTGLTSYADMRGAGGGRLESAVFAGLVTAVSAVPVLGGFYAKMIAMAPGLARIVERMSERYYGRIDAAAGL